MAFWGTIVRGGKSAIHYSYHAITDGACYVGKKGKSAIINHTDIGARLKEGVNFARESVQRPIQRLQGACDDIAGRYTRAFEQNSDKIMTNLSQDAEFVETYKNYMAKTGIPRKVIEGIFGKRKTDAQFMQELIEASGVGPTKWAQIKSNDLKFMERIKLESPQLAEAIAKTKTHCSFTRTVEQAQAVIDKAFPDQGLIILEEMNAASIGAAYKVQKADGSIAVVKMLKKGVTKEQLDMEEKLIQKIISQLEDSPEEAAKMQKLMGNLYHDWRGELNFAQELENNRKLAQGAQRYKVAKITDISKDGTCIVMDMAEGIRMDKLLKILKDYKTNPTEFTTKYAKEIAANPWLSDPEKVMRELPTTITKTFNEQFMFMKKGGTSLMHGDPHTGNFFITADKKGRLIPEFIDTGNCVQRTGTQIQQDINFFSNYFVGNSEGVAKYFVAQSGYNGADKAEITQKIAKEIQETIFGQKHDITKFGAVQGNIQIIMEKYGLKMSPENATALKAQMQFFSVISEVNHLSDAKTNMMTLVMSDIPKASWSMVKNKTNPFSSLKDAIKYAYKNQQQAMGTAYQFTISDVEKSLKLKA